MLPSFLQPSYQAYKEDIDVLAKWLAINAKNCGYPADLSPPTDPSTATPQPVCSSPNLKGSAGKKGKRGGKKAKKAKKAKNAGKENVPSLQNPDRPADAASYIVKVKDFATLAECIARSDKPVVEVPVTVVEVLNRAIELRQQYNIWPRAWVESEQSVDVEDSDQSLVHFLRILERTRDILKPRMPSNAINDFRLKPYSRSGDQENSDARANEQIRIMFDSLDIQEPSQSYLDAPDKQLETDISDSREPHYEAEQLQSEEEQYLATHCLFQDVKQIRSFLRWLWASYQNGDIALVAASIITNTAIDFVRGMEQDILQRFPKKRGYGSILPIFYCSQCSSRGHGPLSRQEPDDAINFEVYDLAEAVMLPTFLVLESLQRQISPDHIPMYESGHYGVRDTTTPWTEKSDREKFRDDRLVLMEAFTDLILMSMIDSGRSLSEDELIRGIRQMAPGKSIPLWLVFAAQCFLDTQHVLDRDVGRGHTELQRTANAIRASITQNLKFHKSFQLEDWSWQNDPPLTRSIKEIEKWIHQDIVANIRAAGATRVLTPREPFELLKQYPLLCGLFSFAIQMNAHELGIDFANAWGSIMSASHLYNATRQEKLLPKSWKDMELLTALQSSENIFSGKTPRDLDAYFERLSLCMDPSSPVFARNRRGTAQIASARDPRGLTTLCTASALFNGRYCRNDQSVTWTPESMQPIINTKMEDNSDNEDSEKTSKKTKTAASGTLIRRSKRSNGSMSITGFLQDLALALHAETLELSFDYFRMHRSCWMFLRKVNEACKPQLLDQIGADYLDNECQLPFVVAYIFVVAAQTNEVVNLLYPKRPGDQVSRLVLAQAAAALDAEIDGGAGDIEIKFIAQRSGIKEIDSGGRDNQDVPDRLKKLKPFSERRLREW